MHRFETRCWQVGAAGIRLDGLEARVDNLEVAAEEQSKNAFRPEVRFKIS